MPPRLGEIETLIAPTVPVSVIVAVARREVLDNVAVSVTVPGLGSAEGAV